MSGLLKTLKHKYNMESSYRDIRRHGRAVRQRSAKPFTPVQLRLTPPNKLAILAWVAELAYATDLKSVARKGLRVRLPPQAPEN
jgi:hypothetical protein